MAIRKSKPKEKKAPEKPTPRRCVCGKEAVFVSARGRGKMITCPDPENCVANYRTPWFSTELQAVNYWNDVTIKNGGKF